MARTTRDKLKRTLSENVVRNLTNNIEHIAEFFTLYSEGSEEAQAVAAGLAMIMESHEQMIIFVKAFDESL